jgi:3-hydroxyisobutyrate dehydrogenase-like beta-hydroxyacid dehydrogenase
VDAGTVERVAAESEVVLSVCPPHAASDVARAVTRCGFRGLYADANAIAPATARAVAAIVEPGGGRFVDGGIIGPPPRAAGTTRLFLSGPAAKELAGLFEGTPLQVILLAGSPEAASAVKMAYAAWSKGSTALLLSARAAARAYGVEDALAGEWQRSAPELAGRLESGARAAGAKGWRWVGEMEEIATTLEAAGLPSGFHLAAAEIFRRFPRRADAHGVDEALDEALATLLGR